MTDSNGNMVMPVAPYYGGSSYADGYSRGYSEAMNQQSGHWPAGPWHGYPPERQW